MIIMKICQLDLVENFFLWFISTYTNYPYPLVCFLNIFSEDFWGQSILKLIQILEVKWFRGFLTFLKEPETLEKMKSYEEIQYIKLYIMLATHTVINLEVRGDRGQKPYMIFFSITHFTPHSGP